MALRKTITMPNGIPLEYHRIALVNIEPNLQITILIERLRLLKERLRLLKKVQTSLMKIEHMIENKVLKSNMT